MLFLVEAPEELRGRNNNQKQAKKPLVLKADIDG